MKPLVFQRQQRLLNASDYTRVFDHVEAKISHNAFLILARHGDPVPQARLGLIAAKKHLKLAVQRNRFKRVIRESFRHHQLELRGFELIVMARSGALNLPCADLRQAIDEAWPRLCKRLARVQTDAGPSPAS